MPRFMRIILVFIILLCACQRQPPGAGIEGKITIFGLNIPASRVTVTAITKTDIKEEQPKAVVRATTDSSGHFLLRGLLPNKYYTLHITDKSFLGSEEHAETPPVGTRIVEKPLIAIPIPPSKGVWVYTSNMKSPTEIMAKAKKITIGQTFVYRGIYDHSHYAFFIDKQRGDNNISAKIPRNSIIVRKEIQLDDIAYLFNIPTKILYITNNWADKAPADIKNGYYYNIDIGMNYNSPTNTLPIIEYNNKTITAIAANKSISNYLMLTTKAYYAPEKNNLINSKFYLGIQDYKCPAEGIIIQIGEIDKIEMGVSRAAKQLPEEPPQQAEQPSVPTTHTKIEFKSKAGRFLVMTPVQLLEEAQTLEIGAKKIDLHLFSAQMGDIGYFVSYSDYPSETSSPEYAERMLDGARNGAVGNARGQLISETRITLSGYPGRELFIEAKAADRRPATIKGRMFMVKNRLYQVMVVAPQGKADGKITEAFLQSFKLLR